MPPRRASIGQAGEAIAARFLESRGAVIVDRNVRCGRDEIDLVASIANRMVAIEVKTGLGTGTRPWESFDDDKQAKTRRAAGSLAIQRIDLISVELTVGGAIVRWLPGAG